MEYACFQEMPHDIPLMEERGVYTSASYQQLSHYNPHFPAISWSTTDPTLLVTSENGQQQQTWYNRVRPTTASNVGVDVCGPLSFSQYHSAIQSSQVNLPLDMLMTTMSNDAFSFGGSDLPSPSDWSQLCSPSSDQVYGDAMPQLVSDSTTQQPCLYTSSSESLHEVDSSGSSERDRRFPTRPSLPAGSPSEEVSCWRNSDSVLQSNLGGSFPGVSLAELPDETSAVRAADLEMTDVLTLVSKQGTALAGRGSRRPLSWMDAAPDPVDGGVMATSIMNQFTTLDPLFRASGIIRSNDLPPYKRQRACYTFESIPTCKPVMSQSRIPPLSQSFSPRIGSDYPVLPLDIAESFYRDFHSARGSRQPTAPTNQVPAVVHDNVGLGYGSRRDSDHDATSLRKPNATSIEPQSVAARHRRKKITERVRILMKLIPGGDKMDTASMLDTAFDYVKFLQLQVQLLESLGEMPGGATMTVFNLETGDAGKDRFAERIGCSGSHMSQTSPTLQQGRSPTSPLILSEVLQEQLFKKKLCLVSIRQCPSDPPC